MTETVRKYYKAALKNDEFVKEVKESNFGDIPTFFSSDTTKSVFAAVYGGWLLGKYGEDWKLLINS